MSATNFTLLLLGYLIMITGLAMGAYLLDVPVMWIAVGVVTLLGLGIVGAVSRAQTTDRHHRGGGRV